MDFKQNPKMKSQIACFKEGGQVYKSRTHKEDPAEVAEDKAMVKKGIRQHEAAQHKGEPKTELKLKTGRRVKKTGGVVNKFKTGGKVDAAEKGKPSGDKDPIKKVKAAPKKAAAPSRAKVKAKETPGKETGPSGDMGGAMVSPEATMIASAPSPAIALPEHEGMQNMADGSLVMKRPWINEEPDDATAPVKKPVIRRPKPKGFEDEMSVEGYAPGGMIPDAVTRSGVGGLGNAINTGALGAAGAMGAPRNVPLSPQEMDIMRGLQAVGSYCKGGKAY